MKKNILFAGLALALLVSRLGAADGSAAVGDPDTGGEAGGRRYVEQTILVECEKSRPKISNRVYATISGYYDVEESTGMILAVDEESIQVSWDCPYWGDLYDPPVLRSVDSYGFVSEDRQKAVFGVKFSIYGREAKEQNFFGAYDASFQADGTGAVLER